ncbi:MAG: amidohydrolase [Clostridiales bacterium]|nr:amidohydrolase [Clostridiales bacterium]
MYRAIVNANVVTMDPDCPAASALAWRDGAIALVGDDRQAAALADEVIDLGGRTVVPGLCDTHLHLLMLGAMLDQCDLSGLTGVDAVVDAIRRYIEDRNPPPGAWVYARGFNHELFADRRLPGRRDLDRASERHPIRATRVCGHMAVANTAALNALGISRGTQAPPGGRIDVDAGAFYENAIGLLAPRGHSPDRGYIKRCLAAAADIASAAGLTAVHSEDFGTLGCDPAEVIAAYRELEAEGKLPLRVYQQCSLPTVEDIDGFFDAGHRMGGCGLYRLHAIKLFADGSLGARTAWLSRPYADDPLARGMAIMPQRELDALVLAAHRRGAPAVIHAIGDAAVHAALDAIERAQWTLPDWRPRHGVIHLQITDRSALSRFRELDVEAYCQPVFVGTDWPIVEARVGDLAATSYQWKALLDGGVNVSGGSDCPVEPLDPLFNLCCAATRQDAQGRPEGGWLPGQRLSAYDALRLFTVNAASAAGDGGRRGMLREGCAADLTVLDRDILSVAPEDIRRARPLMTIVAGEIRHRKGA